MTAQFSVGHVRCEYRSAPLGIDVARPRLSWQLESGERGARQSAFQIIVASSPALLAAGTGDLWDSGRVDSDQAAHVAYAGTPLASGQRAWWQVRVWDQNGQMALSEPDWWEMGLLERTDWRAEWIGAPLAGGPRTSSPAPFMRTAFSLGKPVQAARLYITALGLYEPHLNGATVGDDVLMPGWTDYAKRVRYQVYDVAALLRPGENVLGAILGDGWYCGRVAWHGRQNYGDRPRLLAQLAITFQDGSRELVTSGSGWKTTFGPVLEADMLMGESYDARRELPGWDAVGYDDAGWWPAATFADAGAALVATDGPAIQRQEELPSQAINELRGQLWGSTWIVDMGQNMVGWVRLRVAGRAGETVTLRYAEVLNPNGTIYTTNLRAASNIDHYTLRGDGEEVWEPRFVFHGFRYVEISGFSGTVTPATITGVVVHSAMARTGTFACSDPLLNQLQHNIVWGQKGNFVDVPTDCPQRDERLGWTGDAQVFVRTAAWNHDVAGFFGKWLQDLEDAQAPNGALPMIAPRLVAAEADGGPAWADAGVICPWTIYQCYGDTRVIDDRYGSMCRFVDFLNATSQDGRRNYAGYTGWHGFGDWLALDGSVDNFGITPKDLIGTAFFSHSARLLARMAAVIGRDGDAARYNQIADTARDAFRAHYVTPDGLIAGGTQTCYVLALAFDLLPQHARATAIAALVSDIKRRNNHLSTGFVGTPYLNWVLSESGNTDLAYALLNQKTWPSWLYSVTQGATTIWERWDGWTEERGFQDPGMNSFNHYAYGAIGAWMYAVVAGIDIDPAQPGYKRIIMRPQPGGGLSHAEATLDSIHGRIASAWTLNTGQFEWTISVPANTTALVYVPANSQAEVREGGAIAADAAGVQFERMEEGRAVFAVGAGAYHFSSPVAG